MFEKYRRVVYRKVLLAVLGVTRAFSRMDISFPTRWQGLFSTLQTSSGVAYSTLSSLDQDIDREIQDWEIRFERSFGDRKFYSEEDVEKISKEFSELTVVK